MGCSLHINRETFEAALFGIQNVAQKRTATPILTNVRLDTDGDSVRLFATDYDVGLTRTVAAEVQSAGSAALPARMLYDIVRKSTGETIELEVDDNHQAVLRTGARSKYKLVGMNPEDFPEPTHLEVAEPMQVGRDLLRLWVRKTLFAASTDESRVSLSGVFIESPEGGGVRLVATDTHRLALIEAAGTEGAGILPEEGIILPRKALGELMKILDGEGDVEIAVDAPYVQVSWADTVFVLRTVEGRFPSYRTVIPEETSRTAVVGRQALLDAIDRVSLVVTDRFKSVLVRFEPGTMTLIARNPEMGEGEEQIECDFDGEGLDVGFNANYIQEALGEISTDRVEVKLIDDVSPALIYGEEDRSYLNVIMPMRI